MGSRPLGVVALEAASLSACGALLARIAGDWIVAVEGPSSAAAALGGLAAGYLAADLASGVVHWFADRFFEEDTPVVGPLLIRPFRQHHHHPSAMASHGWLELCGNSALALLPLLAVAAAFPLQGGLTAAFGGAALLAFAAAVLATNVFHCWAHSERVPRLVRQLQVAGLILSPEEHGRHHSPLHGAAYCVTSGWANGPLDRIAFFTRLERSLVRLGLPATRHP